MLAVLVLTAGLSACGEKGGHAPATVAGRTAKPINEAEFAPEPDAKAPVPKAGYSPSILKLEILLDRARFSPGVIDGRFDENLRHALMAYRQAAGIKGPAALDKAVWTKLTMADPRPVMKAYTIDADDVAGPFTPVMPKDLAALARLDLMGYASPAEELAEAFHMDAALLQALNPGAAFKAGDTVLVADRGGDDLGADVFRIEVDPVLNLVRVFGEKGMLAAYPASVGNTKRPAPKGVTAVASVAAQPNYDYKTGEITQGGPDRGPTQMAPGPNSPVGVVWIQLADTDCGIQGAPDPAAVGRPQGRGCITMTNWDARELARAVRIGATVTIR